ncbi:MAG: class I SAM-dependent methyltransferase [Gallionella sp.]|nr:class I SAM-dependent methyltransferase [Gallionella sp.]
MKEPLMNSKSNVLHDKEASGWEDKYKTTYFQDRLLNYQKWLDSYSIETSAERCIRALDIGCGTFPSSPLFQKHNLSAVGVDTSKNMVDAAHRLNRNAILYDGVNLPFESGVFSFISMINTIQFVTQPLELLTEIRRVSKPEATLFMTIANYNSLIKRLIKLFKGASYGTLPEWHSTYTVLSLAELIIPLGFSSPKIFSYSLPTLYNRAPLLLGAPIFRNRYFADNIYLEIKIKSNENESPRKP